MVGRIKPLFEDLKKELEAKNIHLSYQRLKVLEYLIKNHCHPTADNIFTDLLEEIPTLSKTTIYNTLKILVEAGLVRTITIDCGETRYDIDTRDHGHFKCESCGKIYDFGVDTDTLTSKDLDSYKIYERSVYFKGLCPECL
ncbi:MAG: Peroxide operon regulator [Firmicutes bacterium ADurb.Bin456]|nr:MAG: Peroxide operon regulator [Firmicutes bacterium ADurb.Bin456]